MENIIHVTVPMMPSEILALRIATKKMTTKDALREAVRRVIEPTKVKE